MAQDVRVNGPAGVSRDGARSSFMADFFDQLKREFKGLFKPGPRTK